MFDLAASDIEFARAFCTLPSLSEALAAQQTRAGPNKGRAGDRGLAN